MQSCARGEGVALTVARLIYVKPVVRVIDLSGNQIGNRGAIYFADLLLHTTRIISLNLASNSITDEGAEALFAPTPPLSRLTLSRPPPLAATLSGLARAVRLFQCSDQIQYFQASIFQCPR
jgi:hypothetical protein